MADFDPRMKMEPEDRERMDTLLYGLFYARGVTGEDIEHATDRYVETVNEAVGIMLDGKPIPMLGDKRYTEQDLDSIDARVDARLPITRSQFAAIRQRYDEAGTEWVVIREPGEPECWEHDAQRALQVRQYEQSGYKVIEIREG